MAAEKLDKDLKEIAVAILEANGKAYEEWLNEEHRNLIFKSSKLIREGLALKKEMNE